MKTSILLSALSLMFLYSNAQVGDISITVSSLKNGSGSVLIYLYQNEAGFPTEPDRALLNAKAVIKENTCSYSFSDLPFGNYAISIVHDENGNNKLDTNFMGIPKEGIAASKNATGSFGPPKFKDAVFKHQNNQTKISIAPAY